MARGSDTQSSSTQVSAAFRRRLSERDLLQLQRLTVALKHAGATAFERCGVTVHLEHPPGLSRRRLAKNSLPPVGDGSRRQDPPASSLPTRSPRRQRRFERGQRFAVQRKERDNPNPQGMSGQDAGECSPAEPPAGASIGIVDTASNVAAMAPANATITAAPAQPLLHSQQLQQHLSSGESTVLGLEQPSQAVREKRSAPSTPPRVHGERMYAADSGSPESVVPRPKRALVASSSPAPPKRVVEESLSTTELKGIPFNNPGVNLLELDSDESDSEDNENIISDLISESDRPIYAALKAASLGDLSAQNFLMSKYNRGELSPPMREMMQAMTEV